MVLVIMLHKEVKALEIVNEILQIIQIKALSSTDSCYCLVFRLLQHKNKLFLFNIDFTEKVYKSTLSSSLKNFSLTTLWILAGILSLNIPLRSPFCSKAVSWLKPSARVGDGGPELEDMDDDDGEGGQDLERKILDTWLEFDRFNWQVVLASDWLNTLTDFGSPEEHSTTVSIGQKR